MLNRLRSITEGLQKALCDVEIEHISYTELNVLWLSDRLLLVEHLDVEVLHYRLPTTLFCIEVTCTQLQSSLTLFQVHGLSILIVELAEADTEHR